MARPATGSIRTRTRRGRTYITLRFLAYGESFEIPAGTEDPVRARARLDEILDQVARKQWRPPQSADPDAPANAMTFGTFVAEKWWPSIQPNLSPAGISDYLWQINGFLLPHFGDRFLHEITIEAVDAYRMAMVRGEVGEPRRPLGTTSINKTLTRLGQILDLALEYELIRTNPARGRRRRLVPVAPRRTYLEAEQVAAVLTAAQELDRERGAHTPATLQKADLVRELREDCGWEWKRIAQTVGCAPSTAMYLYGAHEQLAERQRIGRQAIMATLILAGLRISELCDLLRSDVDLAARRLYVRAKLDTPGKAKTEAGVRVVPISDRLHGILTAYLTTAIESPFMFPSLSGERRDPNRLRDRIHGVVIERASEQLIAAGRPPIQDGLTPHSLRRTFITLLLEAGENPRSVMAWAGHTDSQVTMTIYAQVLSRPGSRKLAQELLWKPGRWNLEEDEAA